MISACKKLLFDNGLLLIRTPTEEGFLRNIAKMIYWGTFTKFELPMLWFYSFEHIHSFSLKTLNKLLRNHNFSIIKVFREEEDINRLNIPIVIKGVIQGINLLSFMMNKEHKITVIAKKN
jgi:hypothetical protein